MILYTSERTLMLLLWMCSLLILSPTLSQQGKLCVLSLDPWASRCSTMTLLWAFVTGWEERKEQRKNGEEKGNKDRGEEETKAEARMRNERKETRKQGDTESRAEENLKDMAEQRFLVCLDMIYEFYMSHVKTVYQLLWALACMTHKLTVNLLLFAAQITHQNYLLSFIRVKTSLTPTDGESHPSHGKTSDASRLHVAIQICTLLSLWLTFGLFLTRNSSLHQQVPNIIYFTMMHKWILLCIF